MPLYVRFFCDKFVESFLPRLIGALYRCRRHEGWPSRGLA